MLGSPVFGNPQILPKPAALRKACGGSLGADPLVSRGPRVAAFVFLFSAFCACALQGRVVLLVGWRVLDGGPVVSDLSISLSVSLFLSLSLSLSFSLSLSLSLSL